MSHPKPYNIKSIHCQWLERNISLVLMWKYKHAEYNCFGKNIRDVQAFVDKIDGIILYDAFFAALHFLQNDDTNIIKRQNHG